MDTPITRLRNIMTPVVNYFAMLKAYESMPSGEQRYRVRNLIKREAKVAQKNMDEIKKLISMIPSDAIFITLDELNDWDEFKVGDECVPTEYARTEYDLCDDAYIVLKVSEEDWLVIDSDGVYIHRKHFLKV